MPENSAADRLRTLLSQGRMFAGAPVAMMRSRPVSSNRQAFRWPS